jgi:hypothetical protein
MAVISLIPVTPRSVMHTLTQLGYVLVEDDGRNYYFRKTGAPPKGLEELWENWPAIVSTHHPLFVADGYDTLVYDRSDVTDLWVEITRTGRTEGARVVALLRSETKDPDLPLGQSIKLLCAACNKPSKVDTWRPTLTTVTLKCPHCGHEEARRLDRPAQAI